MIAYNPNEDARRQVQQMLLAEGISSTWHTRYSTNPKHKHCFTLRIPAKDYLLFQLIGFNHHIKKEKYAAYCVWRQNNARCKK
ncbi:hypothetical protein GF342_00265 [Candidatus Woesearchaeota archaeon]|nr:hypothetical protein [Candidatus Woesearchaeota archaeon]